MDPKEISEELAVVAKKHAEGFTAPGAVRLDRRAGVREVTMARLARVVKPPLSTPYGEAIAVQPNGAQAAEIDSLRHALGECARVLQRAVAWLPVGEVRRSGEDMVRSVAALLFGTRTKDAPASTYQPQPTKTVDVTQFPKPPAVCTCRGLSRDPDDLAKCVCGAAR